jgi:hypothetical protein
MNVMFLTPGWRPSWSRTGGGVVIDLTYAYRLHKTIERKITLRGAFTSPGLIEDNEREIRKAQDALRAAEEAGTCQ